jgi:tRNA threonylcarbamoyladenosine biosynthesis protein TsaB
MSVILALETSGSLCSVCLDADGNRFEITHHVDRRHNELLLGMIEEVLLQAGLDRGELDGLAFGCGPGSFTGVRIAAACIQALALARDLPVLPVASAEALAAAARRIGLVPHDGVLLTSIRSRARHYYLSGFASREDRTVCVEPVQLYDSDARVPDILRNPVLRIGAQPEWWQSGDWQDISATAADILDIAMPALERNQGVSAEQALPIYVLGDTPWQRRSRV